MDSIPKDQLLDALERLGPADVEARLTSFEAAMRSAGKPDDFIAERLDKAKRSYAYDVEQIRELIADHADDPEAFLELALGRRLPLLVRLCRETPMLEPATLSDEACDADAVYWRDVEVESLELDSGVLVFVAGDLTSAGAIDVAEGGMVLVGGNVRAPLIGGEGTFVCNGDVTARVVYGVYEDGELAIAGAVHAEIALFENHGAELSADGITHFHEVEDPEAPEFEAFQQLLHPDVLDDEPEYGIGRIDLRKLSERAVSGEALFDS